MIQLALELVQVQQGLTELENMQKYPQVLVSKTTPGHKMSQACKIYHLYLQNPLLTNVLELFRPRFWAHNKHNTENGIIGIIGIHDLSATSDPRAHPAPGLRSPRLTRPLQQFRRLRRDAIFLHQDLKLKVV